MGRQPTPEETGQYALSDVYSRYMLGPTYESLALSKAAQAENTRQFDVSSATQKEQFDVRTAMEKEQMEKANDAAKISGYAQLGTTALLTAGMTKQMGLWGGTTPAVGATTTPALAGTAATPALTGSATGFGPEVSGWGTAEGFGTGAEASAGGPSIGGAVPVLAAIYGASETQQKYGGIGTEWADKSATEKLTYAPFVSGMTPTAWSSAFGGPDLGTEALAKMEYEVAGDPLQKAFKGDFGGSIKSFISGSLKSPGRMLESAGGFFKSIFRW
jgi:hypothetical protein